MNAAFLKKNEILLQGVYEKKAQGRNREENSILGSTGLPTKIQPPLGTWNCNSYLQTPFLVYKPRFWRIQCFLLQKALPKKFPGSDVGAKPSFCQSSKTRCRF